MARREERAYREYVSDEQRRQPRGPRRGSRVEVEEGCPARELCDESRLRDTGLLRAMCLATLVVSLSNHEPSRRSSFDGRVLSETLILRQAQDERRVEGPVLSERLILRQVRMSGESKGSGRAMHRSVKLRGAGTTLVFCARCPRHARGEPVEPLVVSLSNHE